MDTDTSNVGVGAVLSQGGEKGDHVVTYFNHVLSAPDKNYCITRCELLAMVAALGRFSRIYMGNRSYSELIMLP